MLSRGMIWLGLLQTVLVGLAHSAEFEIRFSEKVRQEPYTGRVYLFLGKDPQRPPRTSGDWFLHPPPLVALDVENWKPGEPLRFGGANVARLLSFPRPWS